jgi:DivIVA domain-containing protein
VTWFFAVLIVLAIGGVAVVAAGHGAPLGPAYDDRPDPGLPQDRPLTAADLREVRFDTVVRGYRASEVDALVERLAAQLDDQTPSTQDDPEPGAPQ